MCHWHALLDPWDHLTWVLSASQTFLSICPHPMLCLISEQPSLFCSTARPALSLSAGKRHLHADVCSCDLLANAAFHRRPVIFPRPPGSICDACLHQSGVLVSCSTITALPPSEHMVTVVGGLYVTKGPSSPRELLQHFAFLSTSSLKKLMRPNSCAWCPAFPQALCVREQFGPSWEGTFSVNKFSRSSSPPAAVSVGGMSRVGHLCVTHRC